MVGIDRVTEEDEEIRPLFANRVENRIALRTSAAFQITAPGEGDSGGDRRIGQSAEPALTSDMSLGRLFRVNHDNVIAVPGAWTEAVDEDRQGKVRLDAGHHRRRPGGG